MSRNDKVNKLGRAIREYRGKYKTDGNGQFVKWLQPPNPSALARVKDWLEKLGMDVAATISLINGFQNYKQFEDWIKTI